MSRTETISEQLRRILENCGQTRYRIAKDTGISEPTLCRFASGERGLPMKTLDRLGQYLGLRLVAAKPRKRKKG